MNVIDRGFYFGCAASAIMGAFVWAISELTGSASLFPFSALLLVETAIAAVVFGYWFYVQWMYDGQ